MTKHAIVIAALLGGCWADWPPSPDGGTDWYPPVRCTDCVSPYDAGVVDVGPMVIDAPDEDAGADDAGSDVDGGS